MFGPPDSPCVKVCCGPRCGVDPAHRAVFMAVEKHSPCPVTPTLCRGLCSGGVTLVGTNGTLFKVRDVRDVRAKLEEDNSCPPSRY